MFDLRRQVNHKISKKKSAVYKKRENRRYLKGRLYSDDKNLMNEHRDLYVVQMDSV